MATIDFQDSEVQRALNVLQERIEHARPFLLGLGEDMVERSKQRFATATAPDGTPWQGNSAVTMRRYIESRGGVSRKTGQVNAKGNKLAVAKRPLQGVSGDLARQLFHQADDTTMEMGSSMIYAAIQHFGGTKAQFQHLWGSIPGRPFLPLDNSGNLYSIERAAIIEAVLAYLQEN
jgi:phage gpG-like protein